MSASKQEVVVNKIRDRSNKTEILNIVDKMPIETLKVMLSQYIIDDTNHSDSLLNQVYYEHSSINMVFSRDIMQTILSWVYYKHYKEVCELWQQLGETNRNRNIREKCKQFTTKINTNYVLDSSLTPLNTLEKQKRFIGPYKSLGEVLRLQKKLCEPVRVLVKNGIYCVEEYDIANLHIIGFEGLVLFTVGRGQLGIAVQNEVDIERIAFVGGHGEPWEKQKYCGGMLRTYKNSHLSLRNCTFEHVHVAINILQRSIVSAEECVFDIQDAPRAAIEISPLRCIVHIKNCHFKKVRPKGLLSLISKYAIRPNAMLVCYSIEAQKKIQKYNLSQFIVSNNTFEGRDWKSPLAQERVSRAHMLYDENTKWLWEISGNCMKPTKSYSMFQSMRTANTLFDVPARDYIIEPYPIYMTPH
ncbi:MAG: hypothetical protein GY928_18460 [Colwellia sp.]|nr:hypothetical protein [Colwellia sp.]